MPTIRNREGIQFELVRRKTDPAIEELHDSLTDCYRNYWRHGNPKPWIGFDVKIDPAQTILQYTVLHGSLSNVSTIFRYKINSLDRNYSDSEMFATYDADGYIVDPIGRVERAKQWLFEHSLKYKLDLWRIEQHLVRWAARNLRQRIDFD